MLDNLLLDVWGHHPGCPKHRKEAPALADPDSTHIDLFCDCHALKEPMILKNGTDIAWPAGWDEEDALLWRDANGLSRPSTWEK